MSSGELADATIVFDLDGTLVDTAPDIIRALNETMDLEGLPRVKPDTVRNLIGHGARVLLERASALHGVTFSATRLDQLTNEFVAFYAADIARDLTEQRPLRIEGAVNVDPAAPDLAAMSRAARS